jgi:hypothetical protein
MADLQSFLLMGNVDQALARVDPATEGGLSQQYALLYLAFQHAKDAQRAQDQWAFFVQSLPQEGREGRALADMLQGKRKLDMEGLTQLVIDPAQKRVFLSAIAKHNPELGKDLLDLARKLDFHYDVTSLCLQEWMK